MSRSATTPTPDVRALLERARTGHESIVTDAVVDDLVDAVERELYDGASVAERYDAVVGVLTARVERDPAYKRVAARTYREGYAREVAEALGLDSSADPDRNGVRAAATDPERAFVAAIERGVASGLLDERMAEYDLASLAEALEPERNDRLEYMAMETLTRRYFLRDGDEPIELPQTFWMRIAMGLALAEPEGEREERAREFYDAMSTLRFLPSTPTLFHAGTAHPQLSSCYVTAVDDDLEHIFDTYGNHAQLSKWSGGIGTDWTAVRASGARIESTGVESTGVIPFLKIANDVTAAINRSGKRRGAACAYLECWHRDFPAFLDLRRNTGDERRRTHDMNTAAWIPDLFLERVEADAEWTLFSPDEVPDLHECYGGAFAERYREHEAAADRGEIDGFERVPARELWRTTLTRLFETGHPWITFKDPCNVRSPQDHAGVIRSSNLCTEITLNTAPDETAVCNLGSVNLARHTTSAGIDREVDARADREASEDVDRETDAAVDRGSLADTVETAMRMLDNVIDLNFYPTERAERSNLHHRPVGLGVMGFHEALLERGIAMASDEALEVADELQELVAYHAILNSSRLARERGTYGSYEGSKWDRGLLPRDTVALLEDERGREIPVPRTERLDWGPVREHVADHGMRNSNVMAIAPTATISTIAGTTPSIEPLYANLYAKSNMSGEFTVVNDHLVAELKALGLWTEEIRDRIKYHDGSIQPIEVLPEEVRERHRGAFEIDPRHQLELAARRATWIDQSQSLNVFFPSTDGKLLDEVYRRAWELGLKTTYYLRTRGASGVEKATLSATEYGRTQTRDDPAPPEDDASESDRSDTAIGNASTDLPTVEDDTCDACQ